MSTTVTHAELLDREFLGIRAKLIDLAASLDRIRRAPGSVSGDSRMEQIRQAMQILAGQSPNLAEQIQILFSLPYDEHWQK
jgi:hypothetical protein